jgi:hypothetical protein
VNIPYTYLAVLLVFTLLIGVVIGDRLAAGNSSSVPEDIGYSGGCTGLASAGLHECVHRHGHLRVAARKTARAGAGLWDDKDNTDASCELTSDYSE